MREGNCEDVEAEIGVVGHSALGEAEEAKADWKRVRTRNE
jgi:hypothetical protein